MGEGWDGARLLPAMWDWCLCEDKVQPALRGRDPSIPGLPAAADLAEVLRDCSLFKDTCADVFSCTLDFVLPSRTDDAPDLFATPSALAVRTAGRLVALNADADVCSMAVGVATDRVGLGAAIE